MCCTRTRKKEASNEWGNRIAMNKGMKENIGNEYIRRVKLICKSNLNAGNFISGMNAWVIGVMRYSGRIVDWTKEILNRCLQPTSSVARRRERAHKCGGLISVEDCITTERRGLYDYLKESKEDMLSGALKENVIEEGETKEELQKGKRMKVRRLYMKESYKDN